jgi:tetratricopeptide (TPR) repeat protein
VTAARIFSPGDTPRPPAALVRCLPREPLASPGALAEEAADALLAGAPERALACADEALRLSPRLVPALAARAGALAARGKIEEARLAWARALAVDPNDPAALLGSAELHVRRLGPARDALEIGLEYAVRGARAAAIRKDRALAARLELVAGMAENDLGRSQLALPHLERAVATLTSDADAVYERGVALYELCRFDEAQRAFERALALAPDDPWTLHQLGLLAERRGDVDRAVGLFGRARKLAPGEFRGDLPVDADAFRGEVAAALAALPEAERVAVAAVPVEIEDLPQQADLLAVDPPLSPSMPGHRPLPQEPAPLRPRPAGALGAGAGDAAPRARPPARRGRRRAARAGPRVANPAAPITCGAARSGRRRRGCGPRRPPGAPAARAPRGSRGRPCCPAGFRRSRAPGPSASPRRRS